MPAIFTESEIYSVRDRLEKSLEAKSILESIGKRDRRFKFSAEISIFISHKHSDATALKSVVELLSSKGLNLYLDWMDEDMPKITSGETAVKLKDKIKSCDKFILLATENAIESKWCNWELGYGDAHKYINKIAIFPIAKTRDNWTGNEYLQIYPSIQREYLTQETLTILYADKSELKFEKWINL